MPTYRFRVQHLDDPEAVSVIEVEADDVPAAYRQAEQWVCVAGLDLDEYDLDIFPADDDRPRVQGPREPEYWDGEEPELYGPFGWYPAGLDLR